VLGEDDWIPIDPKMEKKRQKKQRQMAELNNWFLTLKHGAKVKLNNLSSIDYNFVGGKSGGTANFEKLDQSCVVLSKTVTQYQQEPTDPHTYKLVTHTTLVRYQLEILIQDGPLGNIPVWASLPHRDFPTDSTNKRDWIALVQQDQI
jgi:hypothetical protein